MTPTEETTDERLATHRASLETAASVIEIYADAVLQVDDPESRRVYAEVLGTAASRAATASATLQALLRSTRGRT